MIPTLEVRADTETVTGQVRFLVRVVGEADGSPKARRVPHHYRLLGKQPLVDCAAVAPLDGTICLEGQKADADRFPPTAPWPPAMDKDGTGFSVGGPAGCLATAPEGAAPSPPWSEQVKANLQTLGLDGDTLLSLAPAADVTVTRLMDLLAAFPAAGLELPRITPQKPPDPDQIGRKKKIEKLTCDATIRDAATLKGAEARWIGELRRP